MTRVELQRLLGDLKWRVQDAGHAHLAGELEVLEVRVARESVAAAHEHAEFVLPRGRRGRVVLVLCPPYEARVRALVAALLRGVTER